MQGNQSGDSQRLKITAKGSVAACASNVVAVVFSNTWRGIRREARMAGEPDEEGGKNVSCTARKLGNSCTTNAGDMLKF
jgi:hypothetical protein